MDEKRRFLCQSLILVSHSFASLQGWSYYRSFPLLSTVFCLPCVPSLEEVVMAIAIQDHIARGQPPIFKTFKRLSLKIFQLVLLNMILSGLRAFDDFQWIITNNFWKDLKTFQRKKITQSEQKESFHRKTQKIAMQIIP